MSQGAITVWVAVIAAASALLGGLVAGLVQVWIEHGRRKESKSTTERADRLGAYADFWGASQKVAGKLNTDFVARSSPARAVKSALVPYMPDATLIGLIAEIEAGAARVSMLSSDATEEAPTEWVRKLRALASQATWKPDEAKDFRELGNVLRAAMKKDLRTGR